MKEMKALVAIITNNSQKTFPLLDIKERQTSKEAALYFAIQQGQCQDDKEGSKLIYGQPGDQRYPMLKSRLKRKLYNHLFFLNFDEPSFLPFLTYEQESLSFVLQARMLINTGSFPIAEDLLKRSLKIAEELGFTSIGIDCLEWLRYIYTFSNQVDAFNKNQKRLEYFRTIAVYEKEAEDLYFQSRLEMNKSVNARKAFLPQLVVILPKLKSLWELHHSPNVFNFYYKLNIWYYELIGDFKEIIRITFESHQFLQQKLIHPLRFEGRVNKYMQVYAYLRIKDFSKGLQLAEEYLSAFDPSTNNWFAYMENYLLMAIHDQQYKLSLQLMKQVDSNAAFGKLTKRAKEKWTLYRAYLYFVNPSEELIKRFDYKNFIQSVPEFSKDKQGFNVAILILQFLHYLKTMQTDALLYRIECLRKYALLHLKDNDSARSKAFFKLLEMVVKEDFHPARCRQKSKYLYTKLLSMPSPGGAFAEIEIIPYEQLWEWILKNLKR